MKRIISIALISLLLSLPIVSAQTLYPNPSAVSDFPSMINYLEFTVHVPIAELIMVMLFIVTFIALKKWDTLRALTPAIILTFMASLMFWLMGSLGQFWPTAMGLFVAIDLILLYFYREP
jgi:hypothetical protein